MRFAGFREPGWSTDDVAWRVTDLARSHARIAEDPHPESDIDAVFQQVDVLVVEHDVDVELGVPLKECR